MPVSFFLERLLTGLQMAGVSEKETSLMVGATPEVIRRHYEKLDAMAIAKRNVERRLATRATIAGQNPTAPVFARLLRAEQNGPLDGSQELPETV